MLTFAQTQAPDVHQVGDLYYLYYAVSTFGSQNSAIGLATSSSLDAGTWTDLGATGVQSSLGSAYNAIDPNLIQVGTSSYLTFGSFWDDIYQVKMSSNAETSSGSAYNLEYNSTGTHPSEGSYMFAYDNYYYLFWSSGICCSKPLLPTVTKPSNRPVPFTNPCLLYCRLQHRQTRHRLRIQNHGVPLVFTNRKLRMSTLFCSKTFPSFSPIQLSFPKLINFQVDKNGNACTSGGGTVVLASHDYVYGPGGQ